jgi:hypothetical protein
VGVPKITGRRGGKETCETAMGDPLSNPTKGWETRSNPDRSQVSALSDDIPADLAHARLYSEQLLSLQRYVDEMHGLQLDTQA